MTLYSNDKRFGDFCALIARRLDPILERMER